MLKNRIAAVMLVPLVLLCTACAHAGPQESLDVLFLTKSSGYEHGVVKRDNGTLSHAEKIMQKLADNHGFEVVPTKNAKKINAENLSHFDVVAFYTSGDLTKRGTDTNPTMSESGRNALIEWIRDGGSFVGIHSASDTFKNWTNDEGEKPYVRTLGGRFKTHGAQQRATMSVKKHPTTNHLGDEWTLKKEEFYVFAEMADDIQPLLVLQTDSMPSVKYKKMDPYPVAWYKNVGEGRVWYNGLGHRADVWTNENFQEFVVRGIRWTARAAE